MNNENNNDAERFLSALETRVQELLELSKKPKEQASSLGFDDYKLFRKKSEECVSFLVIIDSKIQELEEDRKVLLSEQLEKLDAATWSVVLNGSDSFLTVLSERDRLPIGTKYLFEAELASLIEAENIMEAKENKQFLSDSMTELRANTKKLLGEMIERAPDFMEFDALQSEAIDSEEGTFGPQKEEFEEEEKIIDSDVAKSTEEDEIDVGATSIDEENMETSVEKATEIEITSEKENIEVAEDNPGIENQPNGEGESQALGDGVNEVEGDIMSEESAMGSETISKDQEIEVNKNSEIEEGAEDSSASKISDQPNQ